LSHCKACRTSVKNAGFLDLLRLGPSPDQKDVEIAVPRHQRVDYNRDDIDALDFVTVALRRLAEGPAGVEEGTS
jgi:hypothetical protein